MQKPSGEAKSSREFITPLFRKGTIVPTKEMQVIDMTTLPKFKNFFSSLKIQLKTARENGWLLSDDQANALTSLIAFDKGKPIEDFCDAVILKVDPSFENTELLYLEFQLVGRESLYFLVLDAKSYALCNFLQGKPLQEQNLKAKHTETIIESC